MANDRIEPARLDDAIRALSKTPESTLDPDRLDYVPVHILRGKHWGSGLGTHAAYSLRKEGLISPGNYK